MPRAPLVVAVAAALLTGCGGSEEPDGGAGIGETVAPAEPASPPADLPDLPPGTEDLRTAVRAYADALLTGDGPLAYAFLADACRERVDLADLTSIVERAGEVYGEPLPFASYDEDRTGDGVGDTAEVDYSFRRAAGLVQTDEQWERTADGWRLADC